MTGQSDPDKDTDKWRNTEIMNHVAFQKYISVLEEVVVLKPLCGLLDPGYSKQAT